MTRNVDVMGHCLDVAFTLLTGSQILKYFGGRSPRDLLEEWIWDVGKGKRENPFSAGTPEGWSCHPRTVKSVVGCRVTRGRSGGQRPIN